MPPFSKHLYQEGALFKSFKLVNRGVFDEKGVTDALMAPGRVKTHPGEPACSGTRCLNDNLSDLRAQIASNQKAVSLCKDLIAQYSLPVVHAYMNHIRNNAEAAVREMLVDLSLRQGLQEVDTIHAEDRMDDGSCIRLALTIDRRSGSAKFDFAGTSSEIYGNLNAPLSVTNSAVIYVLRCLVKRSIPLNQGCLEPIQISIPQGSMLCPSEDAAIVGGNVETSQRITDVILRAFGACAASQGSVAVQASRIQCDPLKFDLKPIHSFD